MDDTQLALTLARARIGIGVTLVLAPGMSARRLSGHRAAGIEPLLTRMLGARDAMLGLGTVIAIDRGAPVRGWIEASAAADAADCLACLLSKSRMSSRAFSVTLALASGAALAGGYLARRLDPAPPAHPHQPEAAITGHPEP
jgi:hypothetical protein